MSDAVTYRDGKLLFDDPDAAPANLQALSDRRGRSEKSLANLAKGRQAAMEKRQALKQAALENSATAQADAAREELRNQVRNQRRTLGVVEPQSVQPGINTVSLGARLNDVHVPVSNTVRLGASLADVQGSAMAAQEMSGRQNRVEPPNGKIGIDIPVVPVHHLSESKHEVGSRTAGNAAHKEDGLAEARHPAGDVDGKAHRGEVILAEVAGGAKDVTRDDGGHGELRDSDLHRITKLEEALAREKALADRLMGHQTFANPNGTKRKAMEHVSEDEDDGAISVSDDEELDRIERNKRARIDARINARETKTRAASAIAPGTFTPPKPVAMFNGMPAMQVPSYMYQHPQVPVQQQQQQPTALNQIADVLANQIKQSEIMKRLRDSMGNNARPGAMRSPFGAFSSM